MATPLNNSVFKAFAILDLFDDTRQEVSAKDVTELTDLNGITAHRFLKTLLEIGVLSSPRKGIFTLGSKLIDYGEHARSFSRLAARLQPFLNRVAAASNEGAMAATFDGSRITCIAAAHSDQRFSFNARVGARMEAHATANGKLWLALSDTAALESFLSANTLEALSPNTLSEPERLRHELAEIRRRGYATNHDERELGVSAIAVPLRTAGGTLVATMSVFAPSSRFNADIEARVLALLQDSAEHIQNTL